MIVDPPFGVDNKSKSATTEHGKKHARKIANDETPEIAIETFKRVMDVVIPGMKDESDIYVFTAHQVLAEWLDFTKPYFAQYGFERKAILTWEKDGPGMGDLDVWGMGCEFILYFKRGRRVPTDKRRNAVIHVPQVTSKKLIHPHEKPQALLDLFIKHSTSPGDLLVDPFGGSGSLAYAALRNNRHGISIEIDEHNANLARQRLTEGEGAGFDFD